ncbi:MAG TPA: patatin-like phospholipase family protein [Bacteroidia bacterium]|nr:patatin-like phospholipase family protein [Bacteroidia bacterium]
MNKPVALALSGGAIRGFAHIGVFARMEELNLVPARIAGTSIGAVVGAFIADGYKADEIRRIFLDSNFNFDINYFKLNESLLSNKRLEELLKKHIRAREFEDLKTTFHVCASDYNQGGAVYFNRGELIPALLASTAIPLLYKSVLHQGYTCVDGGLSQNLPVEPLLEYGLPIIGVHVNPLHNNGNHSNMIRRIDRLVHLALRSSVESARKHCDVFIEPQRLSEFSLFETKAGKELINIGYEAALEQLTNPLPGGLG